jgi:predicted acylesterase/phospholipase RssA
MEQRSAHANVGDANTPKGPPTLKDFLKYEWVAIQTRRRCHDQTVKPVDEKNAKHPTGLIGLALSGGGIRSATFSLGVLQGLREHGLLESIDYLSTVSGGGFTGGWWSAWLSRDDADEERYDADTRIFPRRERLEPSRYPPRVVGVPTQPSAKQVPTSGNPVPEGSLSARERDPIHHLRLFANYLTPRKGILSADTWRALTVIARNLILTWLVLLPVLFAAVLLTQLYFAASSEHGFSFVCSVPDHIPTDSVVARTRGSIANGVVSAEVTRGASKKPVPEAWRLTAAACDSAARKDGTYAAIATHTHGQVLRDRAWGLVAPLGALFAVAVALTLLWLLSTDSGRRLTFTGIVALLMAGGFLIRAFVVANPGSGPGFWAHLFRDKVTRPWLIIAGAAIVAAGWFTWRALRDNPPIQPDRMRNRLVHYHSIINVALAIGGAFLVIGAFGHEIAWWFGDPTRGPIARAGGWSAVLASIGAAAFTSLRAAPSPKDERNIQRPNIVSRAIFGLTPVLVLVVLAVLLAWLGNWLLGFGGTEPFGRTIATVVLIGVGLEILLAIGELWERLAGDGAKRSRTSLTVVLVAGAVVAALGAKWLLGWDRRIALMAITLTFAMLVFRALTTREQIRGESATSLRLRWKPEPASPEPTDAKTRRRRQLVGWAATLAVGGVGLALLALMVLNKATGIPVIDIATALAMSGVLFVAIIVAVELIFGVGNSDRAIGLASVAAASCAILVVLHFAATGPDYPQTAFARAGYSLIASAIALVIALGWAIDPNLVSLHTFYRARLVRAYMGASNTKRITHDITESAPGDDLPLSALKNHERGGPYHLINTTLNLAGGRDLATAQRSAENFILSSLLCGSARTGYRRTEEYMGNALTLGAAVAISGAAVSPNMGSATPSAALAMLLALFNVRIGFWAPTPDRRRYKERQPRLWPVYLLRESLSQTNDLGNYCYLTDGGHFDNTALYALIERGCSRIVVVDDGADPAPCFGDIGQAIRRCRIDFGTEIELEVDAFLPPKKDKPEPDVHFVKGTIRYSDAHLEQLGYPTDGDKLDARWGDIYWIKPVVRAADSADVRQYKLQNGDFPQQTTADQWFDEAQFESYRRLGMKSGITLAHAIVGP